MSRQRGAGASPAPTTIPDETDALRSASLPRERLALGVHDHDLAELELLQSRTDLRPVPDEDERGLLRLRPLLRRGVRVGERRLHRLVVLTLQLGHRELARPEVRDLVVDPGQRLELLRVAARLALLR